jgi:protein tyrosine/serine phosphatase
MRYAAAMSTSSTRPEIEGVHNFREVGPYPLADGGHLRAGMIYRSGALEFMTDEDRRILGDEIGLSAILDLRHRDELGEDLHALADRVIRVSIFDESTPQEAVIAELNGLYGTGPSPERYFHYLSVAGERFATAFRLFADEANYPLLVHCTAGKDRTGVLVGMVMDVLGAGEKDIATEYGLSNESIDRLLSYLQARGRVIEGTPAEIRARLSTPPERMAGFLRLLHAHHGGAEPYLRKHGIGDAEFAKVRDLLTAH